MIEMPDFEKMYYYETNYNRQVEGDFREQYYIDKRKSYPPDIEQEDGKTYVFKV